MLLFSAYDRCDPAFDLHRSKTKKRAKTTVFLRFFYTVQFHIYGICICRFLEFSLKGSVYARGCWQLPFVFTKNSKGVILTMDDLIILIIALVFVAVVVGLFRIFARLD